MNQINRAYFTLIIILYVLLFNSIGFGQKKFEINEQTIGLHFGDYFHIFSTGQRLEIEELKEENFIESTSKVPNLGTSNQEHWIKFRLINKHFAEKFILTIEQGTIDFIQLYEKDAYGFIRKAYGEDKNFSERKYQDPYYLFDIELRKNETKTFYLQVKAKENILIPVSVATAEYTYESIKNRDLLTGIYLGIMLVMFLYNCFVYWMVRDLSYLWYVIYILIVLLTQSCLQGYPFQYLWPNSPWMAQHSNFIFPALVGIAGMYFLLHFLHIKTFSRRWYNLSYLFLSIYLSCLTLGLSGHYVLSYKLVEIAAMLVSLYMLLLAILVARTGYRPAKYFLIAWSLFLVGVCIYILKDFEILPFNNFTRYAMQIGSAIETVLLSFALADRINVLKKEKETAQLRELAERQEKQQILLEQNVRLEKEVNAATQSLKEKNEKLAETLQQLQTTQVQLIRAEKLGSLGKMAAGVAHEINNPLNIISQSIDAIELDIKDLEDIVDEFMTLGEENDFKESFDNAVKKAEKLDITYLKKEVNEATQDARNGILRTVNIVEKLKTFSRLNQESLEIADIHDGIHSMLTMYQSNWIKEISVLTNFGTLPRVKCVSQRLNQAFSAILENAVLAIRDVHENEKTGKIIISTHIFNGQVIIQFEDNGIGMSEDIASKAFDPFFTTRKVGSGTGLGLSIAHGIIQDHEGKIEIETQPGKTIVTISFPVK